MATGPVRQKDPQERWPDHWGSRSECDLIEVEHKRGHKRGQQVRSDNWSGFVACRRTKETTISRVEALWTVPRPYLPKVAKDDQWYTCSSWIGIGGAGTPGDTSTNMLQVGFDSDIRVLGGDRDTWHGAWYQWVPGETLCIPSFKISPGETLGAAIAMHKGSTTKATIYLYNQTRREIASLEVESPSGVKITGNCAEWIVEKVELDSNTPDLASYGVVCFDEARAFTDRDEELELKEGEFGMRYHMGEVEGSILSQADLVGDHVVRCAYVGPGGRQLHDEFFSPHDAENLRKVAEELEKSAPGEQLGPIKEIVQKIRVRHYRSPCNQSGTS